MNVGQAITQAMQEQKADDEWALLTGYRLPNAVERLVRVTMKLQRAEEELRRYE